MRSVGQGPSRAGRVRDFASTLRSRFRSTGALRLSLSLGAALFVLNFLLSFHNVWPTLWITTRHELSVEVAAIVLLLALYSEVVKLPSRGTMTGLAALLLVLAVGRYAEVTAPALYGRPVNLYWDAPHVLNVLAMLAQAASPYVVVLMTVGLVAAAGLAFWGIKWCLAQVQHGLAVPLARRILTVAMAGLVGLFLIGYTALPFRTWSWFSVPVSITFARQAEFTLNAYHQTKDPGATLCPEQDGDPELAGVAGDDFFLVFLESYGALAYDRPEISRRLAPSRQLMADAARDSGRQLVSALVTSPTFGGASWLAHMSLLMGRPVRDQGTYNLLLTQDCDSLTHMFARKGYRVVGLMPGLKREWPEGAFYGFDAIYGERALQYDGPEFGWWRIPDQFALGKLDQIELTATARAPLFLFFSTISSHMPFRPTPAYQPDWQRLLAEEPFDQDVVARTLAVKPNWTDLSQDYSDTLAYTFEYVSGYLRRRADLDMFMVLVGDHQPPASVSGEQSRWDVPVHVITNRRDAIDALLASGFVSGPEPGVDTIGPMHELTRLLLRALSGSSRLSAEDAASATDQPRIDIAGWRTLGQDLE